MHVFVNAAMSVDGKLSTREREQVAISGSADFARVDRLRREADAIMVGVGTVLADDPSLTVEPVGKDHPHRIVVDSLGRTPSGARIIDRSAPTTVFVSEQAPRRERDRLRDEGATVRSAGARRVDLATALGRLADDGIERLMVEGGGEVIFSLFDRGLVDELLVFVGPMIIGGRDAPTLADGAGFVDRDGFPRLRLEAVETLDEGVLLRWSVRKP